MNRCACGTNHSLFVIGWKFKAEYRRATQVMCSKCMRIYDIDAISERHYGLCEKEKQFTHVPHGTEVHEISNLSVDAWETV